MVLKIRKRAALHAYPYRDLVLMWIVAFGGAWLFWGFFFDEPWFGFLIVLTVHPFTNALVKKILVEVTARRQAQRDGRGER